MNGMYGRAVVGGLLIATLFAAPGSAQTCDGDYMTCAAATATGTGSTDYLHDDSCYQNYLDCVSRMLKFV